MAQCEASRKKERPAQCEAKRKKERPARKGVGTPKKKKKGAGRAAKFVGSGNGMGRAARKRENATTDHLR